MVLGYTSTAYIPIARPSVSTFIVCSLDRLRTCLPVSRAFKGGACSWPRFTLAKSDEAGILPPAIAELKSLTSISTTQFFARDTAKKGFWGSTSRAVTKSIIVKAV